MLKLVGLGLLSVVAAYLLAYWGISLTTATDASLMIIGEVIFTALLALLLTGERLGRWRGLGIALGCVGVVVIVLNGAEASAAGGGLGRVLGNVLLLIALFSQALYTVVGAGLARRYQPLTVITVIYCGSMLVWLPLLLWYGVNSQFPAASLAAWAGVVYLALFPTIIAMLIWLAVLRTVGANLGAISLFVQPLVGMFLGIVVLGDALTPGLALGAALIFAAIGLTTVQKAA
jgi:drug/metabolite transporter (DMT)-like permease